jgi:DNA-binding NarL/FixJ family response regulator
MARLKVKINYFDDELSPSPANLNCHRHSTPKVNLPAARDGAARTEAVLSQTEAQVLLKLAAGKRNTTIARELGVNETAVKDHIRSILCAVRRVSSQGK